VKRGLILPAVKQGKTLSWFLFVILFVFSLLTYYAAIANAGPIINFDYSYDTNGFFTPDRRALLQEAADSITSRLSSTTWAPVDTSLSGGSYQLAFINPSTLNVSWVSDVVIPTNQITVYVGATDFRTLPYPQMTDSSGDGATQLMSIRDVTGGISSVLANPLQFRPVNASISFDLGGIQGFGSDGGAVTRQWYFGLTDNRNPSDPHYSHYTDFYSAAVHELGHVLGIHNPAVFQSIMGLDYDPNFDLAWMRQVKPDGSGGYVFTGSNAAEHYFGDIGQNIPLDTTECHWADGVRSDTADGWTSVTEEAGGPFRVGFSELEFGALEDIGYTVSSVPEPTTLLLLEPVWKNWTVT
jgi:hypothetical protein